MVNPAARSARERLVQTLAFEGPGHAAAALPSTPHSWARTWPGRWEVLAVDFGLGAARAFRGSLFHWGGLLCRPLPGPRA